MFLNSLEGVYSHALLSDAHLGQARAGITLITPGCIDRVQRMWLLMEVVL